MGVNLEEAKQHMAGKSFWHHLKGKTIEVCLYFLASSPRLGKPAVRHLTMWTLEGEEISLDSVLQSQQDTGKMTILNFGSFTCPVWRERQSAVHDLAKHYEDKISCITIYVREAHASDEWMLDMNEKAGISYVKPTTNEARIEIAKRAKKELMTEEAIVYVDDVGNNAMNNAFRAVPIRICVISEEGNLVFRTSDSGPFGYEPESLKEFLSEVFEAF